MPKLWTETIQEHRIAVQTGILNATASLVARDGLRAVTMSQIAIEVGIGRATLYKYFPDVETILHVWHQRQIAEHLEQLSGLANGPGTAIDRLRSVLGAYAAIRFEHSTGSLAALLHQGDHDTHARHALGGLLENLIDEARAEGHLRADIRSGELATYCLAALTAAERLPSSRATERLVNITIDGLTPTQLLGHQHL